VEIGTEAVLFPIKEYISGIFLAVYVKEPVLTQFSTLSKANV
jgi:hypothetical protein